MFATLESSIVEGVASMYASMFMVLGPGLIKSISVVTETVVPAAMVEVG